MCSVMAPFDHLLWCKVGVPNKAVQSDEVVLLDHLQQQRGCAHRVGIRDGSRQVRIPEHICNIVKSLACNII